MNDTHPTSFDGITATPEQAFTLYLHIRKRLPAGLPAARQPRPRPLPSLAPLADRFRAFVFDAFGVLNTGPQAIPGAVRRIRQLQELGRTVVVLSNAATVSHTSLVARYREMGYAIDPEYFFSSRQILEQTLRCSPRRGRYGIIAPPSSAAESLPLDQSPVHPGVPSGELDSLDGFVFLSSQGWNRKGQDALAASLKRRPRPLLVANPDLVAPRGKVLTLEPGFFAHRLMTGSGIDGDFFGKPYAPAFQAVLERLPGLAPEQILMVGDTLHTDILGGQAAGMKTLLVTGHGSLQGLSIPDCIAQSGIAPDYIAPAI